MKNSYTFIFILMPLLLVTPISTDLSGQSLNHFQMIGSHNSYKQAIQSKLLSLAISQNPDVAELDYSHLSISEQLELGLRILEIDIYNDPEGGRYTNPLGNQLLSSMGVTTTEYDPLNQLAEKGFKVFHVQDIDFRSHCLLLKDCLSQIKQWSRNHPDHHPIVITINAKTDTLQIPGSTPPLPFTINTYDQLDEVFIQALGREHILTPKSIQGNHPTLNDAVLSDGWPNIEECKGDFLLVLDEPMDKVNTYHSQKRSQRGIFFTNAPAGHPESAFIVSNNPIRDQVKIQQYVRDGYLVRTRADADTKEAVNNDYTRFEAAQVSGAQYISTDYYYKSKEHPEFVIRFKDGSFSRCNPLFQTSQCNLNRN